MAQQHTNTDDDWKSDLAERARRLNSNGAHYFVGWLLSAGFQKPEIMAAIEHTLRELETNPSLQHCWTPDIFVVPHAVDYTETAPCVVATEEATQSSVLSSPESCPPRGFFAKIIGNLFSRKRIAA